MTERRKAALYAFAAALAFHALAYALGLVDTDYKGQGADSDGYEALARSILHGGYSMDGTAPYMGRTPGYPLFLAAVRAVLGSSEGAVKIVQSVLDSIACALLVDTMMLAGLRKEIRGRVVGVIGFFVATNLFTTALAFRGLSEALYGLCIVLGLWLLVAFPSTSASTAASPFGARPWATFAAGLVLGFGVLTRPVLAFALIVFVALLVLRTLLRERARAFRGPVALAFVLFGAGGLVAVMPWVVRNQITFAEDYRHRDPEQLSLLGYRSPSMHERFLYRAPYLAWIESYEEPLVMFGPLDPPTSARWVYPGEEQEVRDAHATLKSTYETKGTFPDETVQPFAEITRKRYAAAPRLHLTAPATKFGKFWLTPRVAVAWARLSAFSAGRGLTAFYALYNLFYVVAGCAGLFAVRKKWPSTVVLFAVAMLAAHSIAYSIWHPFPQSRYAVPLMPFLALGVGGIAQLLIERRERKTPNKRGAPVEPDCDVTVTPPAATQTDERSAAS